MTSKAGHSLKATFLGGVVAIVPLSAVAFVLWTIFNGFLEVMDAMEGVLPFSPFINTLIIGLASLVALILLCFAVGLALRTAIGNRLKSGVDGLLDRAVPLYGAARKLTQRLTSGEGTEFTPALIDLHGTSARVLGWIVEQLPEDRVAVFVPLTPVVTFGQVYVVSRSRIEPVDVPITEVMGPVTEWGTGTARLLNRAAGRTSTDQLESSR